MAENGMLFAANRTAGETNPLILPIERRTRRLLEKS